MLSSHWCQSSLFKVSQPSLSQASLRADFFVCRTPSSPKLINWLSWSSFLMTFEEVFFDDFLLLETLSDWLPWPQVSHPLVQSSEFCEVKFVDLKPIYGYFGRLWAAEEIISTITRLIIYSPIWATWKVLIVSAICPTFCIIPSIKLDQKFND